MNKEDALVAFEDFKIRRQYNEDRELWLFSVVDIIAVLIQQPDYQTARKYWNKLKSRLKKEGSQSVTDCHQLRLEQKTGRNVVTGENFLPPAGSKKKLNKKADSDES